jgi:hypothetical protein
MEGKMVTLNKSIRINFETHVPWHSICSRNGRQSSWVSLVNLFVIIWKFVYKKEKRYMKNRKGLKGNEDRKRIVDRETENRKKEKGNKARKLSWE